MITQRYVRCPMPCSSCSRWATRKIKRKRGRYRVSVYGDGIYVCVTCANTLRQVQCRLAEDEAYSYSADLAERARTQIERDVAMLRAIITPAATVGGRGTFVLPIKFR